MYKTDEALKQALPQLLGQILTGPDTSVDEFQTNIQRMLEDAQGDEASFRAT